MTGDKCFRLVYRINTQCSASAWQYIALLNVTPHRFPLSRKQEALTQKDIYTYNLKDLDREPAS